VAKLDIDTAEQGLAVLLWS